MTDAGFIIAAYAVILGGIGLYAALLVRRLRIARNTALPMHDGTDATSPPDAPR